MTSEQVVQLQLMADGSAGMTLAERQKDANAIRAALDHIATLEREVAATRPVVEAAMEWGEHGEGAATCRGYISGLVSEANKAGVRLLRSLAAYRAAQPKGGSE